MQCTELVASPIFLVLVKSGPTGPSKHTPKSDLLPNYGPAGIIGKIIRKSKENHKNNYGHFWAKYAMILFKNKFNMLIYFSGSPGANKTPISLY